MTWWYLSRAAGIVALISFTAATVLGASVAGRAPGARAALIDQRYLVQMAHRSAALTGLLALATHVVLLVADTYVDVNLGGAVVPFTAGYRPLALAAGTVGAYAILAAAVSGASRGRLASSARAVRAWRPVHLLAYIGWMLSMAHGIFAGTDSAAAWAIATYVACGVLVAGALAVRVRAELVSRRSPLSVARAVGRSRS